MRLRGLADSQSDSPILKGTTLEQARAKRRKETVPIEKRVSRKSFIRRANTSAKLQHVRETTSSKPTALMWCNTLGNQLIYHVYILMIKNSIVYIHSDSHYSHKSGHCTHKTQPAGHFLKQQAMHFSRVNQRNMNEITKLQNGYEELPA